LGAGAAAGAAAEVEELAEVVPFAAGLRADEARGDFPAAVERVAVRDAGLRAAVDLRDPVPAGLAARAAPEPLALVEGAFSSGIASLLVPWGSGRLSDLAGG